MKQAEETLKFCIESGTEGYWKKKRTANISFHDLNISAGGSIALSHSLIVSHKNSKCILSFHNAFLSGNWPIYAKKTTN